MTATLHHATRPTQQSALTRVLWRSLCANVGGRHVTPSLIGGDGCDIECALQGARACTGDDAGGAA